MPDRQANMPAVGSEPFGILSIDKPPGITSHDVVNRLRRRLSTRRIGHTGTLDPMATGVLVCCVGAATRLAEYIGAGDKVYEAEIALGMTTSTLDVTGEQRTCADASGLEFSDIERALASLTGDLAQIPPMHAAVRVGGVRLYELARRGETVERSARAVTIHELTLRSYRPGRQALIEVTVRCSAGTYIRSLADDLGERLGVGGCLAALRRTRVGAFRLADAHPLDGPLPLMRPEDALASWPLGRVDPIGADDLRMGRAVGGSAIEWIRPPNRTSEPVLLIGHELLAVVMPEGDRFRPHKVLHAPPMEPAPETRPCG